MKLKQISPCKAHQLKGWIDIGQVIMADGNHLIIMADKKEWRKKYDSRSQKRAAYKLQRKHKAQ